MPLTTSNLFHRKAMESMKQNEQQNELDDVVQSNPHVDPTAIERSRQVVKQLADAGIEIGGYHLAPSLSSEIPLETGKPHRRSEHNL